jgi:hypothetical protein
MSDLQPFETEEHDLTGHASVDFYNKGDFMVLAQKLIANYDPSRFEPFALRFFILRKKPIITFYAFDKSKKNKGLFTDKLPAKKFKTTLSLEDFLALIKSIDFTVTNKIFDIKNMLVINK